MDRKVTTPSSAKSQSGETNFIDNRYSEDDAIPGVGKQVATTSKPKLSNTKMTVASGENEIANLVMPV